jgi:hypothetical protein
MKQLAFLLILSLGVSSMARPADLTIENGWLNYKGSAIWGLGRYSAIWKSGHMPNITRNAPGRIGPNLTENLDRLTDSMLAYGYPAFEHSFGLWYDRRRDQHDRKCRSDDNVEPPFLEQPWGRSGEGIACDGLSKYDLTKFNQWYFDRLKTFAKLCDQKGAILYNDYYNQHPFLERRAHYVDFPWRPENTIQSTQMPTIGPAANVFYDVSHPVRKKLHRMYIRKVLDEIGSYENVFHFTSLEYTGSVQFVRFWMDTILEWEREVAGRDVKIGVSAPKDVIDNILNDPGRGPLVDAIDLRYFWYRAAGELQAIPGGSQIPGRFFKGKYMSTRSSPQQIYRQTLEYRKRYPDKALFHSIGLDRRFNLSFLMGGGSLNFSNLNYVNESDPTDYEAPVDTIGLQPAYDFIRTKVADKLPGMKIDESVVDRNNDVYVLSSDNSILVYTLYGQSFDLDLGRVRGSFSGIWFSPGSGKVVELGNDIRGGEVTGLNPPSESDWLLLLEKHDSP